MNKLICFTLACSTVAPVLSAAPAEARVLESRDPSPPIVKEHKSAPPWHPNKSRRWHEHKRKEGRLEHKRGPLERKAPECWESGRPRPCDPSKM